MKKIVIINGHPDKESYNHALGERYKKGALSGEREVKEILLSDMQFNPVLPYGYRKRIELEADLSDAWEKIRWADHLVWIYPLWWGFIPASLKGFIDRLFLPGFTYQPQSGSPFPRPLLKGKTAEIICTMDTPVWYYKYVLGPKATQILKKSIFAFCGLKNIRTTYLAVIKSSTEEQRQKWLEKVENLGRNI